MDKRSKKIQNNIENDFLDGKDYCITGEMVQFKN